MRTLTVGIILTALLCGNLFAQPTVLTQGVVNGMVQNEQVHLTNWTQNDDPDYIVKSDIYFDAIGGHANANLLIDAGTRIWFDLGLDNDSHVNDVYVLYFAGVRHIQCGGVGSPVVFEPNPGLSIIQASWDQVAGHDDFDGTYPEGAYGRQGEKLIFAGGFNFGSEGNSFVNTTFTRLIGDGVVTLDEVLVNNSPWLQWQYGDHPLYAGNLGAFRLTSDGSTVNFSSSCHIIDSFDQGCCIGANHTTIHLDASSIKYTYSLKPHSHPVDAPDIDSTPRDSIGNGIIVYFDDGDDGRNSLINLTNQSALSLNGGDGVRDYDRNTYVRVVHSSIDMNTKCGINFEHGWVPPFDPDGSTLYIQDESSISDNLHDGIYIGNSSKVTASVGTEAGNCHIDGNHWNGISMYFTNHSVTVASGSSINNNFLNGVYIGWQYDETLPGPVLTVEDQSTVDENLQNGIFLESARSATVNILDHSSVSNNIRTGIRGDDTWWTGVLVDDQCNVDFNGESGIWFTADARIAYGDHIPGSYCSDCDVTVSNNSSVSFNQGQDQLYAGIGMYGQGHIVQVLSGAQINSNASNGVRMDGYDFSRFISDGNSSLSLNGRNGVWVYRPYATSMKFTRIQNNSESGAFLEGSWNRDRLDGPDFTGPVPPGDHGMQASLVGMNSSLAWPCPISGNNQDGIALVGEGKKCDWVSITLGDCDITTSGGNGLRINSIESLPNSGVSVTCNGTNLTQNTANGIDVSGQFGTTQLIFNGVHALNNTQNGMLISQTTFTLAGRNQDNPNILCQPLAGASRGTCFNSNGNDGVLVGGLTGGLFLTFSGPDSLRQNSFYGIELGAAAEPRGNFAALTTTIDHCYLSGNQVGAYLSPTEGILPQPTDFFVYGCKFDSNPTGIYSNLHGGAHLWVAPRDPEIMSTVDTSYFTQHTAEGIRVAALTNEDPSLATSLLVDKVQFNDICNTSITKMPALPVSAHIYIEGTVRGGRDAQGNFGVEDFGTIRRCMFGLKQYGIYLRSRQLEDNSYEHPQMRIRNNFFIDTYWAGVLIETFAQGAGQLASVRVFNNTLVGDQTPSSANGIEYTDAFDNLILSQDAVVNNIIQGMGIGVNNVIAGTELSTGNNCFYNNGQDLINCDDAGSIFTNPLRISATSERISYNSPCINGGLADGGFSNDIVLIPNPDGSNPIAVTNPIDIGCTGGESYIGVLGHDPYPLLPTTTTTAALELAAAGEVYAIPATCTLLDINGHLTVHPNTTILFEQGQTMKINGNGGVSHRGYITANGLVGGNRTIRFYPKTASIRWSKLQFYTPYQECDLNGCDIWHADYNVYAYGGANPTPRLNIRNSRLTSAGYYNLYVSGPVPIQASEGTQFCYANRDGMALYSNGNQSSFDRCSFDHNGSDGSLYSGVYLSSSTPATFTRNTIGLNYARGLTLSSSSLNMNGFVNQVFQANTIYDNGPQTQSLGTGAEIYLTSSSNPTIRWENIWDIHNRSRRGIFAYKTYSVTQSVDLQHCFWGGRDSWSTEEGATPIPDDYSITAFDQDNPDRFFYKEAGDDFLHNDFEGSYVTGASKPNFVDDIDDFDAALASMSSANYPQAIDGFWRYLENGKTNLAINALNQILLCTEREGGDLMTLRTRFLEYASSNPYLEANSQFTARKLAGNCMLADGQVSSAYSDFTKLRGEAPSLEDSLALEMEIAYVHTLLDGDHTDALTCFDNKIQDLREQLDKAENDIKKPGTLLPECFLLSAAYPNPFNSAVCIRYQLPRKSPVSMKIYDLAGRLISTLIDMDQSAGYHSIQWTAENEASGLYFCRMETPGYTGTTKLLLTR